MISHTCHGLMHDYTQPFTAHAVDMANRHICRQRRHWPANADIWHLRFHGSRERARVMARLRAGLWQPEPLSVVTRVTGHHVVVGSGNARSAVPVNICATRRLPRLRLAD